MSTSGTTTRRLGVAAALVGDRLLPGDVVIAGGRVEAVGVQPAGRQGIAAAGFVDLQVNGYAGVDLLAADGENIATVRTALARDGVTAFVPTLITADAATTTAALTRFAGVTDRPGGAEPSRPSAGPSGGAGPSSPSAGSRVLGVHLEGPWISPDRLGTHPPAFRRDASDADVDALLRGGPVRIVTLAPERPGALDLVRRLVADGVVVMLGHSAADAPTAAEAFDLGAAGATHLFNAMAPFHHREPGLVGAALARPGAVVSVIADGHHLAPETLAVVFAAAPDRVALITDAIAAAGMSDGRYFLGDVAVTVQDGVVRNDAGVLAGSAATMSRCIRGAVAAGIELSTALVAATRVPADLVGRHDLGRLRPGLTADVVVLDDHLDVTQVLIAGEEMR